MNWNNNLIKNQDDFITFQQIQRNLKIITQNMCPLNINNHWGQVNRRVRILLIQLFKDLMGSLTKYLTTTLN